ncbi:hypothetical protein ISN45_Aa07g013820 [Arabidopsis thaliana x Arabidopsis arenosa]|uniref:Uncharacterized protein n=1 Tax=Arabidopsis thaliana x Arabidopsis arenosa TaxID=1240361 RepID=A0A8T1Y2M9_9BRAS|nr:hypothetical protein ISN45_Aa07g013820 [Arabidopsis thaliana x Arabidopsis arenosa]
MAATFLAKRGGINIYRASSLQRDYNNGARSVAHGVITITNSRYFTSHQGRPMGIQRVWAGPASHGNNGGEKSKEEAMGTTTDGKAPNVTLSHAANTAKEGLKRATDAAIEKSGGASKTKSVENDEGDDQENVAVGDDGTVKGQNQSGG